MYRANLAAVDISAQRVLLWSAASGIPTRAQLLLAVVQAAAVALLARRRALHRVALAALAL